MSEAGFVVDTLHPEDRHLPCVKSATTKTGSTNFRYDFIIYLIYMLLSINS